MTAADGGRSKVPCAAQVCFTCKGRKKKCDKVLPCCGYCVRKGLGCEYEPRPRHPAVLASQDDRPAPFTLLTSHTIPSEPNASESSLHLHAHHLIRATGQFVDDISAHYFQGLHRYLPIISRTRFLDSLITPGATPSAGFSALLLSICLATTSPELGWRTGDATNPCPVDRRSFYLATKSFFAQVQALFPPSVHLIQAGLLLAVYEYAHDRPDEAFVSIASCARMAYAARIHLCNRALPQPPGSQTAVPITDSQTNTDLQLQAEEAANTWWGIVICERIFFSEVTVSEQPLVTFIPSGDARLPIEPIHLEQSEYLGPESVSYTRVSCLTSTDVGAFGRAAQAAWLLDQILKGFEIPSLDSRLIQLRSLDTALQTLLGVVMQQCDGKGGIFCEAIAITIRALFTLHWHILRQPPQATSAKHQSLDEWCKCSHSTLDTATKMILDIVEAYIDPHLSACVPPSYSYIIRAALKHVYARAEWRDDHWLRSAEERLRTALDELNHQ